MSPPHVFWEVTLEDLSEEYMKNVFRKDVEVGAEFSLHSLVYLGHLLLDCFFFFEICLLWWQHPVVLPVGIPSCCDPQRPVCFVFSVVQEKKEPVTMVEHKMQQTWTLGKAKENWWLIIQRKLHELSKIFLLYISSDSESNFCVEYSPCLPSVFFFFFLACSLCHVSGLQCQFLICVICFVGLNLSTQMEKDGVLLLN